MNNRMKELEALKEELRQGEEKAIPSKGAAARWDRLQ